MWGLWWQHLDRQQSWVPAQASVKNSSRALPSLLPSSAWEKILVLSLGAPPCRDLGLFEGLHTEQLNPLIQVPFPFPYSTLTTLASSNASHRSGEVHLLFPEEIGPGSSRIRDTKQSRVFGASLHIKCGPQTAFLACSRLPADKHDPTALPQS